MTNPLGGFYVNRDGVTFTGRDLQRPECILAAQGGTLWTADGRGGVMEIGSGGGQRLIAPNAPVGNAPDFGTRYVQAHGSLPNGLAFTAGGEFVIANWGTDTVEVMTRDGAVRTLCSEIGGQPLGKVNFPLRDSKGRIWFSITTREVPWTRQLNTRAEDGYVAVIDDQGARIVAEGFCGTNEIRFDAAEEWLYVVESTGRRISRLRAGPDAALSDREVYGPADLGGHPDGFAFDAHGNLWITLIFADRLIALTPEGDVLTLLDDGDAAANAAYERAFAARQVTPEVLAANAGTMCPWMASLTFGGPDLQTVYLGSLRGTSLPSFRSPVPGAPMIHWAERA